MKKILFITGNKRKIWQAQSTLEPFGIEVEAKDMDITEIQAHDPLVITEAKAVAAYYFFKQPLVICDHSWSYHALKGFPGGYMKDINKWFELEDWLALMKGKKDRRVTLTETVMFIDGDTKKHFAVEFPAKFIDEARGNGQHANERLTVFDGFTETVAERVDAGQHARDMSKSAWQKFGEWYGSIK
jgi:inosine/xanthosine triphosphate pyrophosphatase family protein